MKGIKSYIINVRKYDIVLLIQPSPSAVARGIRKEQISDKIFWYQKEIYNLRKWALHYMYVC